MGDTKKWYDKGLNFGCERCSFCCGKTPGFVFLSKSDRKRLYEFLKISEEEFLEKYCRKVTYYGGKEVYALIELKNHDCILWNKGCSCYEARPVQCRTYPFWSWVVSDKETWDDVAKDCPGMNKGTLWPRDYIDQQCALYDENEKELTEENLSS